MNPRKSAGRRLIEWLVGAFESLYNMTWLAQFMTSAWAFINGMTPFIKSAGEIFPPVAYSFDGLKALLSLIYPSPLEGANEVSLYLSKISNFFKLALNILTVLAFVGIFGTTPIGWAIASATTFVGWMTDDVIPAFKMRPHYYKELKEVEKLTKLLKDCKDPHQKGVMNSQLAQARERMEKTGYLQKRNNALWGIAAVAGMVLFTLGTFGIGTVALIGTALFAAVAIRGVVNRINKPKEKPKVGEASAATRANEVDVTPDSELSKTRRLSINLAPTPAGVRPEPVLSPVVIPELEQKVNVVAPADKPAQSSTVKDKHTGTGLSHLHMFKRFSENSDNPHPALTNPSSSSDDINASPSVEAVTPEKETKGPGPKV
jgi:hypothetical protein